MSYTVDTWNLLLGLAWFGAASTVQIGRLWRPGQSSKAVRGLLSELCEDGLVERHLWAKWDSRYQTPRRQDALWSLTRRGLYLVKDSDQFPPEYKGPRTRKLFDHDSRTVDVVTRIIELAREAQHDKQQTFSGIYLEREIRLDPERRRPLMDALIILTIGGEATREHRVPWSRDPTIGDEQRIRYALENDRDSEPLSVIAGKARAYQHAGTQAWVRRYGRFPLPIWLVPDEARLQNVMHTWQREWPVGKWLLTTDDWLGGDYWIEYDNGAIRERGLFYRTGRRPTTPKEEVNG
jgi:hypothetical protein